MHNHRPYTICKLRLYLCTVINELFVTLLLLKTDVIVVSFNSWTPANPQRKCGSRGVTYGAGWVLLPYEKVLRTEYFTIKSFWLLKIPLVSELIIYSFGQFIFIAILTGQLRIVRLLKQILFWIGLLVNRHNIIIYGKTFDGELERQGGSFPKVDRS